MDLGIIAIILWITTILGFIFRNLWIRNQKLEELATKQAEQIEKTKAAVEQVTQMFDSIDEENIFRANDYVGQMWLELKALNEALKQYK